MDIITSRAKVQDCNNAFHAVESTLKMLVNEEASLISKIKEFQSLVDNKQNVVAVLEELNRRTQARTKSVYENLLTSLLKEVKPDDPENDSVVLQTEIKKNRVSLDVGVRASNGCIRNAYQDKGRSVENIIAMGLRFISVSRTSNRRLIIMDEADNNLRQEYIPAFARIMSQLARQIGMQVIYISHHPASCFTGHARIIGFERVNGKVVSEVLSEPSPDIIFDEGVDASSRPCLRYIRLVNTKQHENTFIELSPGLNVITADIDVGKSTLAQAIEAVAQNEGRDGLIRDGEASLLVEIGIEDGKTLCWEYNRKGSRKTKYTLFNGDGSVCNESYDGQYVPAWLHDYLGMEKKHDFDIHISDSHNSSFILDKRISSFKRADLLSLGRESADVQKMIRAYAEKIDKSSKLLNESRRRLDVVQAKIVVAKEIYIIQPQLSELSAVLNVIEKDGQRMKGVSLIGGQITAAQKRFDALNGIESLSPMSGVELIRGGDKLERFISSMGKLDAKLIAMKGLSNVNLPEVPKYRSPNSIVTISSKMGKLQARQSALSAIEGLAVPVMPEIGDANKLASITKKMEATSLRLAVLTMPGIEDIVAPEYKSPVNVLNIGMKIGQAMEQESKLSKRIQEDSQSYHDCIHEKELLVSQIGGRCPLCEQTMPAAKVIS